VFLVFAMAFEWDKWNNPAERSAMDARLGVSRVVQLEEMNWGPAIPKSELGAAFAMRFRATVSRRNKQGLKQLPRHRRRQLLVLLHGVATAAAAARFSSCS